MKTEVLVRSKEVEDDQVLKERMQMTRSMSPAQLGTIRGISDIPVPTLRKKKKNKDSADQDSKSDVGKSKENLYEKLPSGLKTEVLVRTKVEEDEAVLKERQEMTRAMSPSELAQIRGFGDIPFPSFGKKNKEAEGKTDDQEESKGKESYYDKMPAGLKTEVLVRTKVEEDESVLKQRQEMTRAMSPAELSQFHGLSDFPIPTLRKKKRGEVDRERTPGSQKDLTKSKENLYEKLPSGLKTEVLVRTKVEEDEAVLKERQEMTRSMSPSQLAEIHGFSDIPIPNFLKKKGKDETDEAIMNGEGHKSKENLYEKLPDSLKTEVLVRTKEVEDDQTLKERMQMTRSMSPAELGTIRGFSDFPVPTFMKKKKDKETTSQIR